MNKLLVMGANPETVSLVLKAKEMGFYTIVTDYDPHAYAKQFADQAENVNAIDVDALVELAEREHVSGVLVGVAEIISATTVLLVEYPVTIILLAISKSVDTMSLALALDKVAVIGITVLKHFTALAIGLAR